MFAMTPMGNKQKKVSIGEKLLQLNWSLVLLVTVVASIGFAVLYSAAHGSAEPWMDAQIKRFGLGVFGMLILALIDLRLYMRFAYAFYAVAFILLVYVEFLGEIGMGAQRWINLGFMQLQPSEMMKIALVLSLARYFHGVDWEAVGKPWVLIPPTLLAVAPAGLVMKQPDLGTAGTLMIVGGAMFFAAGVRWWKFAIIIAAGVVGAYFAWNSSLLHDYQKARILTFLDPESDVRGAGYHIIQSKIALGSGGVWGKGFLQGTQSHLDFLPERHTDFIFTMFAEEWGLVGGIVLLTLYSMLVLYGVVIALRCRSQFGKMMAFGLSFNLFTYFFINTAMVMGLIPVVGVPLPLISYGGTAMMTVLAGFGLMMSAYVNRDAKLGRTGREEN
ncbi:rod shape-determining protein RodA [Dongia rigui]|uniref:Peptidoglycan glycosyltransferase MrdB n=1 Tax=Dongia rigui TaxID=940149 RepID=A0ABU5DTI4_9PROT|nr:rod shape-determining protein RodA [Dongia rigui]MDY0870636.1 rod shape-determining protein RodA [Dongia rigui]